MAAFFSNLRNTVIAGAVIAALLFLLYLKIQGFDGSLDAASFWLFLIRWLHVLCGVMWIGLLWYFNFVSTPTTPKIPEELRPALGKYITPEMTCSQRARNGQNRVPSKPCSLK